MSYYDYVLSALTCFRKLPQIQLKRRTLDSVGEKQREREKKETGKSS